MAVYSRGNVYWYKFYFAGRFVCESTRSTSKTVAKNAERNAGGSWKRVSTILKMSVSNVFGHLRRSSRSTSWLTGCVFGRRPLRSMPLVMSPTSSAEK